MEVVDRILFRKINPSDFRNMYEVAKPTGGGGQTYVEAAGISDDALADFLNVAEIAESKSAAESRFSYAINCYAVGDVSKFGRLEFAPRTGRNYRICRQNLAHRHPAWSVDNGFPEPEKDGSGKYKNSDLFGGIIDNLLVYVIRTTYRRYYAGFVNSKTMPVAWPSGIGLESMFEGERRGVVVFKLEGPGFVANNDNPFLGQMGPCATDNPSNAYVDESSLLAVALMRFTENRQKREWCADALAEKGGMPASGYVSNKALRGISITPQVVQKLEGDQPSHLKSWFNSFCDPKTNKSWIDGVPDADLTGLGPYIAHLLDGTKPEKPWPQTLPLSLQKAIKTIADPAKCGMYDKRVHDVLKFFGRAEGEFNPAFTDDDYQDVLHEQRVIRKRLKGMGQKQIVEWDAANNQAKPNNEDPDFLTVNEFLWWVSDEDNQKKISKESEVKQMKATNYNPVQGAVKGTKPKVSAENPDDVLLVRLMAALRTKPFAILAGHSGTGKSRMVRKLAYMTCRPYESLRRDEHGKELSAPGNFCMVQVKPNWHDSLDLLGYYSENKSEYRTTDFVRFICKAYAYPDVPFFVCLDEMNLAPVEQYFAEFLSAIESRKLADCEISNAAGVIKKFKGVTTDALVDSKVWGSVDKLGCETEEGASWLRAHGLTIPRNLFVVGTVNMDESTNQFSRKVLDRAMTIEMNDADFDHFGIHDKEPSFADYIGEADPTKYATDPVAKLLDGELSADKLIVSPQPDKPLLADHQVTNLNSLKMALKDTSFVIAYRFANEYALYENALDVVLKDVCDLQPAAPASGGSAPSSTVGAKPDSDPKVQAFDDVVQMKLLPRIADEYARVKKLFHGGEDITKDPENGTLLKLFSKATSGSRIKMLEMLNRKQPFVTFWP